MRLQILSDLHLDMRGNEDFKLPQLNSDVIVLAGDLSNGPDIGLEWIEENIPTDKQAIVVLGNHDYYFSDIHGAERKYEELLPSNVHLLQNDSGVIDHVRFLGCTLWTDFELDNQFELALESIPRMLADYRAIYKIDDWDRKLPINAYDTIDRHHYSKRWLQEELDQTGDWKKTVVVTHHMVSKKQIHPRYQGQVLNAGFTSNLDEIIERYQPDLWVTGHGHDFSDISIGYTRLVMNPRGYPHETPVKGFNPNFIIEM